MIPWFIQHGMMGPTVTAAAVGRYPHLLLAQHQSGDTSSVMPTAAQVLNGYLFVFVIAFLVALLTTPVVRLIAVRARIVDHPDGDRKHHRASVPYLGGVAVFLGLVAGICASYLAKGYAPDLVTIPPTVLIAMTIIMVTGLADDVFHWDPNLKIGGQFCAAAVLALDETIGSHVAEGLLRPIQHVFHLPDLQHLDILPGAGVLEIDVIYWAGAVIIAMFVLGACNAANLTDGLDGLLTGSTAIMAAALLVIAVKLAINPEPGISGELTGARVVLCFALLGATLGFLPHNFRPATIFLGDAGSLLLGFSVIVIVLMLGETGQTHLVFAGLIVFSLPIIDTTLAIIRRKSSGAPLSKADNRHLHHLLTKTRLRTVGSVALLYGVNALFAMIAIMLVFVRARVVYALVLVLASFIVVTGTKFARKGVARNAGRLAADPSESTDGPGDGASKLVGRTTARKAESAESVAPEHRSESEARRSPSA